VVAVAFAVRAFYVLHPLIIWDSAWYLVLARSFADTGTSMVPWTDPPQYSGYWPPLFPLFAAPFVKLLGARYATLVTASATAAGLLTLTVFLTTWDLMGRARAFGAAALVAVAPAFLLSDFHGMAETTLELAVVLLMWAFLKSLRNRWFLLPAAACALLVYLGKPNVGAPLVALALVAVAAWRVRWRGWRRVLTDPIDVSLAAAWALGLGAVVLLRPGSLGGVGIVLIDPVKQAITFPLWVPFFLFKLAFAAVFLVFTTLPFSVRARRAVRWPQSEGEGYLWVFVLMTILATALFTTSFLITEKRGPLSFQSVPEKFQEGGFGAALTELFGLIGLLTDFDNIRYLSPAVVPFLWLVLPHWPFEEEKAAPEGPVQGQELRRRHEALYATAVAAFLAILLLSPLAIEPSLDRLVVTVLLALVPLGVALAARGASYDVQERRAPGGLSKRFVRAAPPPVPKKPLLWSLAGAAVAAYFFSSWFLVVTLGVLVAFSTSSPRARVVAVALMLLFATCLSFAGNAPYDQAGADMAKRLPPGTRVGATGVIPYVAATMPRDLVLRQISPEPPAPPTIDAVVATDAIQFGDPNFTLVQEWNATAAVFPSLDLRLAIERNVLSQEWNFPTPPIIALYVRNGTAAAAAYGVA
jgi:hypothetical protein